MEGINTIIIIGTLFTILIILLAAMVIFSAQRKKDKLLIEMQDLELRKQKEISENTLISQELERQRISLELHDELGPTFAAARMDIQRIQNILAKSGQSPEVNKIATEAGLSLAGAINQFSALTRMLYPVILNRFGITEALKDIVEKSNNAGTIDFRIEFVQPLSIDKEVTALAIYRVCQELSTNALKHSRAKNVLFSIDQDEHAIKIEYRDDGVGYDTSTVFEGLGLNSINRRIEAIDGKIDVISSPNKGVHITIAIPYEHNDKHN